MKLTYQWNITGHQRQLAALENELLTGQTSHAYLFSGPQQVGKFSVAKVMAHILQCEQNFCHSCPTCIQIEKGYHPDTIEMADAGTSIKIEGVRDVLARLYMTTQSPYKILLMQNIERMTLEAANALLKTLEEPPGQVKFLLTTGNIKMVPATILSRVRLYQFHHLPASQMAELFLQHRPGFHDDERATLAALALGKPGKALALLENDELYHAAKKMYDDLQELFQSRDRAAQFSYIAEMAKDDHLTQDFLDVFLALLRQELLKQGADNAQLLRVTDLITHVEEAQNMLRHNVNTRLVLENLMLSL